MILSKYDKLYVLQHVKQLVNAITEGEDSDIYVRSIGVTIEGTTKWYKSVNCDNSGE